MILSAVEIVLFLKRVEMFGRLSNNVLTEISYLTQQVSFDEGEELIKQGASGDWMCLIVRGEARIEVNGKHITTRGPGDCIGEMSLLDSQPRSASVIAETDMLVLRLDAIDFTDILDEQVEAMEGILRVLAHKLRQASRQTPA